MDDVESRNVLDAAYQLLKKFAGLFLLDSTLLHDVVKQLALTGELLN